MGVRPERNRNRASRSTVAVSGRKTYATPKASFIGRSPAGNDAAFRDENARFFVRAIDAHASAPRMRQHDPLQIRDAQSRGRG
jgi:hypothetical protein